MLIELFPSRVDKFLSEHMTSLTEVELCLHKTWKWAHVIFCQVLIMIDRSSAVVDDPHMCLHTPTLLNTLVLLRHINNIFWEQTAKSLLGTCLPDCSDLIIDVMRIWIGEGSAMGHLLPCVVTIAGHRGAVTGWWWWPLQCTPQLLHVILPIFLVFSIIWFYTITARGDMIQFVNPQPAGKHKLQFHYLKLFHISFNFNIDGLVQERRNSSALAMELHLSCTNPSI